MRIIVATLEEPYRSRALPPGSPRFWCWLFAAPPMRAPLLGINALLAEWHALLDPGMDGNVARLKLAWWSDELQRLTTGTALHPISRYLAPMRSGTSLASLQTTLEAAAAHIAGAPLERAAGLSAHADALYGLPLLCIAQLADPQRDPNTLHGTVSALAGAEYRVRALADYRRDARAGRVQLPIDELLAAGIDNEALAADVPTPELVDYLDRLRAAAAGLYAAAAHHLPPAERSAQRHLAVLARLGSKQLQRRGSAHADFRFSDLYNAWSAAREAGATNNTRSNNGESPRVQSDR